jgi:hypothetical protein
MTAEVQHASIDFQRFLLSVGGSMQHERDTYRVSMDAGMLSV